MDELLHILLDSELSRNQSSELVEGSGFLRGGFPLPCSTIVFLLLMVCAKSLHIDSRHCDASMDELCRI